MEVTIKKQDGTEITLTGPGAEVCVVLGALVGRKQSEPEPESDSSVMLTGPEWDKLVYLYGTGYRWLARDDDGCLFAYREMPFQSGNHWLISDGRYTSVTMELFTFVRIEDEEPTEIAPIIRAMKKETEHE